MIPCVSKQGEKCHQANNLRAEPPQEVPPRLLLTVGGQGTSWGGLVKHNRSRPQMICHALGASVSAGFCRNYINAVRLPHTRVWAVLPPGFQGTHMHPNVNDSSVPPLNRVLAYALKANDAGLQSTRASMSFMPVLAMAFDDGL